MPQAPPPAMPLIPPANVPHGTLPLNMGQSAPAIPTPPSPVSATPEAAYNDKASGILGGLDPAKISQLLEGLKQQSNKSQIGAGIAGIGDAIASVGGVQPGHMKNAEEAIRGNYDRGLKAPELMANAGKERFGLSQTLQEQDPKSPLSKYAQDAYGGLGDKLGIDLRHASAKMIGDVTGKTIDQLKNEAEEHESHELHAQTAAIQQQGVNNQTTQIKNTEKEREDTLKQTAAEGLDKRGIIQKTIDAIHPSAATKLLQSQVAGQPQTVRIKDSTGQLHDIPSQNLQKAKQRDPGLQVVQ